MRKNVRLFSTIYGKLILFSLMMIISMVIVGMIIFDYGRSFVENEIDNGFRQNVSSFIHQFSMEVKNLKTMQNLIFMNDTIRNLSFDRDAYSYYEYAENLRNAYEFMGTADTLNPMVSELILRIPNQRLSVSSVYGPHSNVDFIPESRDLFWQGNVLIYRRTNLVYGNGEKTEVYLDAAFDEDSFISAFPDLSGKNGSFSVIRMKDDEGYFSSGTSDLGTMKTVNERKNTVSIEGRTYRVFVADSEENVFTILHFVPTELITSKLHKYSDIFLVYIVLSGLIFSFFIWYMKKNIDMPISRLVGTMQEQQENGFSLPVELDYSRNDEFMYLNTAFRDMCEHMHQLIDEVYMQKILTQKAELRQLQSQINPHFLYNSFFNISLMAENEDYESIETFTKYLSSYYRYITRNKEERMTLEDEYDHAVEYLNIQKMRFGRKLTTSVGEIPDDWKKVMVPKLMIQPLIENSFVHGLKKLEQQELSISIVADSERLDLMITDNDEGLTDEEIEKMNANLTMSMDVENTATVNINKRLKFLFGDEAGLNYSRDVNGGLRTRLRIMKGR